MTPHEKAVAATVFGVVVGIVGGWLFTPLSLVVLPLLYLLALRRYIRKESDRA